MPIHDLRCPGCHLEQQNQIVKNDAFPLCPHCKTRMTWIPFVVATDCYGSTKTSDVLYEDIGKPATYSSRRELEKKMSRLGYSPCGDSVGGARNNDGYKGTSFAFKGQRSRSTPRATRPSRET